MVISSAVLKNMRILLFLSASFCPYEENEIFCFSWMQVYDMFCKKMKFCWLCLNSSLIHLLKRPTFFSWMQVWYTLFWRRWIFFSLLNAKFIIGMFSNEFYVALECEFSIHVLKKMRLYCSWMQAIHGF